jgi:hypothetical protein
VRTFIFITGTPAVAAIVQRRLGTLDIAGNFQPRARVAVGEVVESLVRVGDVPGQQPVLVALVQVLVHGLPPTHSPVERPDFPGQR